MVWFLNKIFPHGLDSKIRVLSSLPRSGTHWLKNVISTVLDRPPLEERLEDPDVLEKTMSSATFHSGLFYDHFDFDRHSHLLNPHRFPKLKMILLYRHPLDALISKYYRAHAQGKLPIPALSKLGVHARDIEGLSVVEVLKLAIGKWQNYPPQEILDRDNLRRYVVDWIKTGYVYPVKYERLISHPLKEFCGALDFLEIQYALSEVKEALEKQSFQVLSGGRARGAEDPMSHYRKGLAGEWKLVFNNHELNIVRERIGDYLDFLGYSLDENASRDF